MSMSSEKTPEKQHGLSTRGAVLVTIGIVLILGVALFIGFWVVPMLQTHAAVLPAAGSGDQPLHLMNISGSCRAASAIPTASAPASKRRLAPAASDT